MRHPSVLGAAIASLLEQAQPQAELPATDLASVREVDESLARVRIVPVKPGHPREPRPQRFEMDPGQGVCYVREADWPALQAALARRRASSAGA